MLARPAGCCHAAALRRLPSASTISALPTQPTTRLLRPQSPNLYRPIGVDRRLLTTRSDRPELRSWRPKTFYSGIGYLPERTLATALNDYSPIPLDDHPSPLSSSTSSSVSPSSSTSSSSRYSPLMYSASPSTSSSTSRTAVPTPLPLWELRPHNPHAPLVLQDVEQTHSLRQKINTRGIPGDLDEMLSVLDACLQVGKLDRAALVLKRLSQPGFSTPDVDIVELHNRYLRAVVDQLLVEPDQATAEELHKWYELEMRGKLGQQTPETIAYMLKASLLTAHGARRERLVDRYMGLAPGDAGLEVLYMTGILNDQDRAAITDICRTYNLESFAGDVETTTLFEEALRSIDPEGVAASQEASASASTASRSTSTDTLADTPDAPAVLGTPQKGMGLRMLKQTLSLFSEIPQGRDIASLNVAERREIQSRLERDCVDAAVERWTEENQALLKMGLNTSLTTASLNSRLYEWHRDLELRLSQELKKIEVAETTGSKNKEDLDRCLYGPFLRQSLPNRLAAVTIVSTLSGLAMQGADKGISISNIITQIARVAEEDIRLQQHTKMMAARGQKTSARAAAKTAAKTALRKAMATRPQKGSLQTAGDAKETAAATVAANAANAAENAAATASSSTTTPSKAPMEDRDMAWPITIKAKVGAALLSMLMETAKVTAVKEHPETRTLISQQQPAFSRINQLRRGKKVGMLVANSTLVELMKREPRGDFLARHLPMVVEPQPWQTVDKGGFLEYPAPLVRVKDSRKDQKIYAEAAIARGDMDQVLKGLDVLGRTAWKVNRPVFNVLLEAWNTGEEIADVPPISPNIVVPPEPDSSEDPMKRRTWLKAVKAAENLRSGLHSVRCFMNFQMEIARAFRDQTFYFPHNVDFRGRAYPIPPYFNHMGADHVRGLLTFAKGKALGEDGLRWLKVHLANVFGYDKASLSDRAAFADEHVDKIRDSATNPLKGERWWLQAEDPWQCLAACIELSSALALDDPTQFVSHLPVHQDGTCNGLQHYAALGGDEWGAQQVNLVPGDRPADVYSAVADIVKAGIAEDAANGDPNAKALEGKIKRKVVKQTVMTNVYGVTFAGARKQVLKQLDNLYPTLQADTDIPPLILASYIAAKIFSALSTMFSGAHDIQHWLGETGGRVCRALTPDQIERIINNEPNQIAAANAAKAAKAAAKLKTKSGKPRTEAPSKSMKRENDEIIGQFRSTLVWTTPLQMPVVQPYRKSATKAIETCLQDLILSVPARSDPVNMRKQLQAFPPNFIHSLDASHMLLSALECDALGLQFAAVHDSFWTHAADINTMNRVLRDAFVRIHSEDVVGRLAREFEARYRGSLYLAKVNRSSPVAKKILALRKASPRMSLKDELVLENKRLNLLGSDDPASVAKGRNMVTPGSLFAKAQAATDDADAVVEAEDLSEFSLGSIPKEEERLINASTAAATTTTKKPAGRPKKSASTTEDDSTSRSRITGGMSLDGMGSAMGDVATADEVSFDEMEDESASFDEAELEADAENEAEHNAEDADEVMSAEDVALSGTGHFEAQLRGLKRTGNKYIKTSPAMATKKRSAPIQIWVPLTFPAIPAKGTFDVRRLKDSDYFFS
ncbi:DNA-directed RNA polymerase [Sporothrix stenoceras]|uniref:DNA-directed RNA polymerase n=1 Tax=Sporothrix stenoceras TaxID=5173 RepID=A0ABR3ZQN9_9PEZI